MSTLGPLDHIARPPLPWRTGADLTECGKPITEFAGRVITRDDMLQRIRDSGKQRVAFSTCMTCVDTSNRWTRPWQPANDAVTALARETESVDYAMPPRDPEKHNERWICRQRLTTELEALAALVEAHRDEFDEYLTGLAATVKLADRRQRRR